MAEFGEFKGLYHETEADHAESKPPIESLTWSFGQSGLEHPRTNGIPHLRECGDISQAGQKDIREIMRT